MQKRHLPKGYSSHRLDLGEHLYLLKRLLQHLQILANSKRRKSSQKLLKGQELLISFDRTTKQFLILLSPETLTKYFNSLVLTDECKLHVSFHKKRIYFVELFLKYFIILAQYDGWEMKSTFNNNSCILENASIFKGLFYLFRNLST